LIAKREEIKGLTGGLAKFREEFSEKEEMIKMFQKEIDDCYI
jgi:hypothetical protein